MDSVISGPKAHPWLEALDVYEGGKSSAAGVARVVKLSSNESPFGASPRASAAYREAGANLHRYPDAASAALKEAIAEAHGIDASRIVCGLGSDEILKLICRAYAGPGDEVLFSRHGFMMYPIAARGVGATPIEVADRNLVADVDALLGAVTERTRVLFLANPNNPTGTYLPRREVERLAAALPPHVVLVLDAAYAEYVEAEDYTAGLDLVDRFPNIVVTHTFSKIYGLAALRLGWGYGAGPVISMLDRLRDPFNISTAAQAAGIAALEDRDFVAKARRHNSQWLPWITAEARKLGLEPVPSVANFVLMRFPDGEQMAAAANEFLMQHGYILRWLPKQGLGDCLRMTVGLEEDNRAVIDLLARFLSEARP